MICLKQGQQYELDRDKWTNYSNSSQMHGHVYEHMKDVGNIEILETAVWQNMNGYVCTEDKVIECNVIQHLAYSKMGFVMDEVRRILARKEACTGASYYFVQKDWCS